MPTRPPARQCRRVPTQGASQSWRVPRIVRAGVVFGAMLAIIGFVLDRSMAILHERRVFWDRRSAPTGGLW